MSLAVDCDTLFCNEDVDFMNYVNSVYTTDVNN